MAWRAAAGGPRYEDWSADSYDAYRTRREVLRAVGQPKQTIIPPAKFNAVAAEIMRLLASAVHRTTSTRLDGCDRPC